jgi:hypothetical protein
MVYDSKAEIPEDLGGAALISKPISPGCMKNSRSARADIGARNTTRAVNASGRAAVFSSDRQ